MLCGYGFEVYEAPEELRAANSKGTLLEQLDQHKTDVFSIGVTFVQLTTLKSSEDLYNYKDFTFHESVLTVRKEEMARSYSEYYCKVIDSLADMNIETRCTCGETWAVLNPNAEEINLLKKFTPIKSACEASLRIYKQKMERRLKK